MSAEANASAMDGTGNPGDLDGNRPACCRGRTWIMAAVLAALAIIASAGLMRTLRWGLGLSSDSASYLTIARDLARGVGINAAFRGPHFPPLFPAMLAPVVKCVGVGQALDGARDAAFWLNTILFGLNTFLVGWIGWRATGPRVWPGIIASLLFITQRDILTIHAMAWSEPLFIFFMLAGCALLLGALGRESWRWGGMVAAAVAIGMSLMTRYVGAGLIVGGTIAILLQKGGWWRRCIEALLFASIAAAPMVGWTIRNVTLNLGATDRPNVYHEIPKAKWQEGRRTFYAWAAPQELPKGARTISWTLFLGGAAALLGLALARRPDAGETSPGGASTVHAGNLVRIAVSMIVGYVVVLIYSLLYRDAQTPLDDRILSPGFALMLLLAVALTAVAVDATRLRLVAIGVSVVVALTLLGGYGVAAGDWLGMVINNQGIGYGRRAWSESPTLGYVKSHLSDRTLIYSNESQALVLLAGKNAGLFPPKVDHASNRPNAAWAAQMQDTRRLLLREKGFIVYFGPSLAGRERRRTQPSEADLMSAMSLRVVERFEDGVVYQLEGGK